MKTRTRWNVVQGFAAGMSLILAAYQFTEGNNVSSGFVNLALFTINGTFAMIGS